MFFVSCNQVWETYSTEACLLYLTELIQREWSEVFGYGHDGFAVSINTVDDIILSKKKEEP